MTLAVMHALLGFTFEARWLRHAHACLARHVPLPTRPARLQQAPSPAPGVHLHGLPVGYALTEATVDSAGIELLRPGRKGKKSRPGARFFKPLLQIIESISDTLKGQLDPARHGGRTPAGASRFARDSSDWPPWFTVGVHGVQVWRDFSDAEDVEE
nr:hypothetical protein [Specibacter cremeus]